MAQTFTNTFNGEAIRNVWLRKLVEGMDVLQRGYAALHTGISYKLMLPTIDLTGDFVQPYAITPGSVGTFAIGERFITPTDLSVVIGDLDPREFEKFWSALGTFNESERFTYLAMNPVLLNEYTSLVIERTSNVMASNIWQGNLAAVPATPSNKFTGLIKQLTTLGGFVDVSPAVPAAITAANVKAYLDDVYEAVLAKPALLENPALKFFVSRKTASLYMQAEEAVAGKGRTSMDMYDIENLTYYGVKIAVSNKFPDDYIIATYASNDVYNSNLHVGVRNASDMENVVFEKQANGSKGYILRADMSIGTTIGTPSDVVYLKAV